MSVHCFCIRKHTLLNDSCVQLKNHNGNERTFKLYNYENTTHKILWDMAVEWCFGSSCGPLGA